MELAGLDLNRKNNPPIPDEASQRDTTVKIPFGKLFFIP